MKNFQNVNDDGSYTFGYETAKGEFKVETKDLEGNVRGERTTLGFPSKTSFFKAILAKTKNYG